MQALWLWQVGLAALWHCNLLVVPQRRIEPTPPGLAGGSITTGPPGTAPGADPFCLFTSQFVSYHGCRLRWGRGFSARPDFTAGDAESLPG